MSIYKCKEKYTWLCYNLDYNLNEYQTDEYQICRFCERKIRLLLENETKYVTCLVVFSAL